MDNRLLILAASFAFLLFSMVYLVVAMVRARRVPPPPMPDISDWLALNPAPPELVAASAEDQMFAEPTTGMAALLSTPLRASEWKPADEADLPRTSRVDDYWDTLVEDEALLIRPSGHTPDSNPLVTDIWPDISAAIVVETPAPPAAIPQPAPEPPAATAPVPPAAIQQPVTQPESAPEPATMPPLVVEPLAPAQETAWLTSAPGTTEDPQIAWIEQLVAELDEDETPSPVPPSVEPDPAAAPPTEEPVPPALEPPISPAPVVAAPGPPAPHRPAVVVHETQRPPVVSPVKPPEPPKEPEPRPAVVIHPPEPAPAPAEIPEHELVAPVEMWFGDVRIGVKKGTGTYDRFQMIAKVLFDEYKRASAAK